MSLSYDTASGIEKNTARLLSGRVALVTGSGRGLGKAIAESLARLGADICIHDIHEDAPSQYGEARNLTSVCAEFAPYGVRVAAVTGDISNEEAVRYMAARAESELGPISILVNCAGGDIGAKGGKPDPNDALGISLEDLRAVLDRNLIGTMLMCRAICPGMVARRCGSVINIGSVAGHYGGSPEVAYACAKAAILHFTRCLAFEMRPFGVRVNAVSPGPSKTARFLATRETDPEMMEEGPSLKRYATPREVADVVAFLAGEQSRFVSGQVVRVDGGMGLYPG